jgi:hypothetical protein
MRGRRELLQEEPGIERHAQQPAQAAERPCEIGCLDRRLRPHRIPPLERPECAAPRAVVND